MHPQGYSLTVVWSPLLQAPFKRPIEQVCSIFFTPFVNPNYTFLPCASISFSIFTSSNCSSAYLLSCRLVPSMILRILSFFPDRTTHLGISASFGRWGL